MTKLPSLSLLTISCGRIQHKEEEEATQTLGGWWRRRRRRGAVGGGCGGGGVRIGSPRRGARSARGAVTATPTPPPPSSTPWTQPPPSPPSPTPRTRLLDGLAAFEASCARLLPTATHAPSVTRVLLTVPALQPGLLALLFEKLLEHFTAVVATRSTDCRYQTTRPGSSSRSSGGSTSFDADVFVEKLVQVLSVACKEEKAREFATYLF
ncbi:hypothetical protein ACP4OV_007238 [Aristida adscensionis]